MCMIPNVHDTLWSELKHKLSPFIIVSSLPKLSVTPKLGPRSAKIGPEPPKMGKITIFPKLKGIEVSFLFPSPHFPPH